MANTKISQLSSGDPAQSGDLLPIDRSGSNFSLTARAIADLASGGPYATSGTGYFIGPGVPPGNIANTTAAPLVTVGQEVRAVQFYLPFGITIGKVTYAAAATVASSTITGGVYNAAGSIKLIDSGTFNGGSSTAQSLTPLLSTALTPGFYWFAWSASTQTTLTGLVIPNFGTSGATFWSRYFNNNTKHYVISGNAAVAGLLPASLNIAGAAATDGQSVPLILFES